MAIQGWDPRRYVSDHVSGSAGAVHLRSIVENSCPDAWGAGEVGRLAIRGVLHPRSTPHHVELNFMKSLLCYGSFKYLDATNWTLFLEWGRRKRHQFTAVWVFASFCTVFCFHPRNPSSPSSAGEQPRISLRSQAAGPLPPPPPAPTRGSSFKSEKKTRSSFSIAWHFWIGLYFTALYGGKCVFVLGCRKGIKVQRGLRNPLFFTFACVSGF